MAAGHVSEKAALSEDITMMATRGDKDFISHLSSLRARENKSCFLKRPCSVVFITEILMKCPDQKTSCFSHFPNKI